jgi:hypothetical protein
VQVTPYSFSSPKMRRSTAARLVPRSPTVVPVIVPVIVPVPCASS